MKFIYKLGIEFNKLIQNTKEIKIISPFIGLKPTDVLIEHISRRNLKIKIIIGGGNFLKGSDVEAIEKLLKLNVDLYLHRNIHSKLYIFDQKFAILGSANLTNPGFGIYGNENVELSALFENPEEILELDNYFEKLYGFCKENEKSSRITLDQLKTIKIEFGKMPKNKQNRINPKFNIGVEGNPWDVLPNHSWLKFEGSFHERIPQNGIVRKTEITKWMGETHFSGRPTGIKSGDELFMVVHTDNSDFSPVVVGIVKTSGFDRRNIDNKSDYPYFVKFVEGEFIDAPITEGFSLRKNLSLFPNRTPRSWAEKSHIKFNKKEADTLRKKMRDLFKKRGSFNIH